MWAYFSCAKGSWGKNSWV
jgi:hypothetical protein